MKTYRLLISGFFILGLAAALLPASGMTVHAQSEDGWTVPVNLSNSGATTEPSIVIDDKGVIHVFWYDSFDGYQYTNSPDGVKWSEPQSVQMPFLVDKAAPPIKLLMLAGANGVIHILWKDNLGALQYRQSTTSGLGSPSTWTSANTLASSVVAYDAVVDSKGALNIGYINNIEAPDEPAGIYYRQLGSAGWSVEKLIYPSRYFRSLKVTDDANINLAATTENNVVNTYIAWDDRAQRRIFLSKSSDGGQTWGDAFQVRGPEDFAGVEQPYNIDLGAAGDQVLLTWQVGVPGKQCAQYSQWSSDGAQQFGQPMKMLEEFAPCPQSSQFMLSDKDLSVLLLNTFSNLSLIAWDGSNWSSQLTQNEITSFINPVTLESVFLGCQTATYSKETIFIVGCDTGTGGDIWFTSRPVGSTQDWFPPPSIWSDPVQVSSADQRITSLLSVADQAANVHNIWVQDAKAAGTGSVIQYSRWNGEKWSNPTTIISGSQLNPAQPTLAVDESGKLLLSWVNDSTGDILFTWANAERASSASEWETPVFVPSVSSANSSPDIVSDASGRVIVSYAVPINEDRGIYIVETDDFGTSWSKPYRVFDASAVNWHMVDQPKIVLTGDGKLHILFGRYSLNGDQRNSVGLYYIQSSDGGVTWSQPEQVSEQPILWSELIGYGESTLHRIWQEQNGATKESFHEFSTDGGKSWGPATTLSSINSTTVLNNVSIDLFGDLYFLQATGPQQPAVLDQRWDISGWKTEERKALGLSQDAWEPSAIVSSVSSDGNLVASLMINSSDTETKWKSQVFSLAQFLEPSAPVPTPFPVLIATPGPLTAGTQTTAGISETSTPQSPLAGIQDTQSFWTKNKNIVGLSCLGGLLIFGLVIFLATSRSRSRG